MMAFPGGELGCCATALITELNLAHSTYSNYVGVMCFYAGKKKDFLSNQAGFHALRDFSL